MPFQHLKNGSNKLRMVLYPTGLLVVAALIWVGWGYQPAADLSQRLASAEMLVRSGAFEPARTEIAAVLEDEPENLHGLLLLGMLEERQLHEARAIRAYELARRQVTDESLRRDIDLSLIDLERRMKRLEQATKRLDGFVIEHGPSAQAERLAGLIAWEAGRHEDAIERLTAARNAAPEDVELTLLLAGAFIEQKRADDARSLLESMAEDCRKAGGSWKELARLYVETGDERSALEALGRYVELDEAASKRLARDEFWSSYKGHELFGRLIGG